MRACCEGPLGAVREEERPSWLTAVPQTIAVGPAIPLEASGTGLRVDHTFQWQSMV